VSSPPRLTRKLFELQRPERAYNEQELAALVAKSLSAETKPTHFLIIAVPGDGSSTVGQEIEGNLRASSVSDFSFAYLNADKKAGKGLPWVVRALIGDRLKEPLFRLRLTWDSLRFAEKGTYALLFLTYIITFNLLSLWLLAWGKGEAIAPKLYSLLELKAFTSILAVTILGTAFPAAAIAYWRSLWRSLSEADLEASHDQLMSIIKRNSYRALLGAFNRQFAADYRPLTLLVDGLDDLSDPIDQVFLYDYFLPMLKRTPRTVIIAISKFPSDNRLIFCQQVNNLRIFSLDFLSKTDLSHLTGHHFTRAATVKEALGLGIHNEDRQKKITKNVSILAADHSSAEWNHWTIFSLLSSAAHLDRRGFTQRSLEDVFKSHLTLINCFSKEMSISEEISIALAQNILRSLFQTDAAKEWFIFDGIEHVYHWDGLARRELSTRTEPPWRIFGAILWVSSLFRDFEKIPENWKAFEIERLVIQASETILDEGLKTPIAREICTLMTSILGFFRRSGFAGLRRACGVLYFAARPLTNDPQRVVSEDIAALEALALCGLFSFPDLETLIVNIAQYSEAPQLLRLVRNSQSGTLQSFESTLEEIRQILDTSDSEVRVAARWLYLECHRQHYIVPMTALSEVSSQWDNCTKQMPPIAGGFNLATLSALDFISDAGELGDNSMFLSMWTTLADGIVKVSLLQPTNWEMFWLEYVSIALLTEVVSFCSSVEKAAIYDYKGFRLNIYLDSLGDQQFALFLTLGGIVGLELPDKRFSAFPVASLHSLTETFDGMRLKCLVLSLRELAANLSVYHAKLILRTVNFVELASEDREGVLSELQRIASSRSTLHRRTLGLEALIQMHHLQELMHKNLSSETIVAIIRKVEKDGCPPDLINLLYERYIQELRFSHNDEKSRQAIRMLLRRIKRQDLSNVRRSKWFCYLSSDLFRIRKINASKFCLQQAKRCLNSSTDALKDPRALAEFRDAELQIFIEGIRPSEAYDQSSEQKMVKFLGNVEYRTSSGNSFLLLLWLAANHLSLDKLEHMTTAARAIQRTDWYAGYIWSLILGKLVLKWSSERPGNSGTILQAIDMLIEKLGRSDKNGMDLDSTIESLQWLRPHLAYLNEDWCAIKVSFLHEELLNKRLTIAFREAMTLWTETGSLGEIAFAYYRLLAPYIEERLPPSVRTWANESDYLIFKNTGMQELGKYLRCSENAAWLPIYVAGQLERRARHNSDHSLQKYLQRIWLQIGVNCLESLIETTIASASLPTSIRNLLRQQVDGHPIAPPVGMS
jgi:hypothetical protein